MVTQTLRSCAVIFLLFFTTITSAQQGSFLVNNHLRESGHSEGINFQIISDNNGLLSMANNQGVYQYDGKIWDFYPTPSAALSISADDDNQLYVGCINGFGTINWRDYNIHYIPLHDDDTTTELFYQTEYHKGKVYFLSDKSLFIYDPGSKKVEANVQDNFLNLFKKDGYLYVNTETSMFLIEGNVLKEAMEFEGDSRIASVKQNGETAIALGFDGLIYRFENDVMIPLETNIQFEEYGISAIEIDWVNDEVLICSTLDFGCIFINLNDPDYLEVLDNATGLPDNEIYATHVDKEQGVWVSHEYGLSRILPSFPAKSYSHLPGLQGNLLAVNRYHDKLWLSTSSGVFYVDQDTTFAHKVYYVAQRVNTGSKKARSKSTSSTKKTGTTNSQESKQTDSQKTDKKKKGKFNKLFNRNQKKKDKDKNTKDKATADNQKPKKEKKKSDKPGFLRKIITKVDDLVDDNVISKVKERPKNNIRYVRRTKRVPIDITYKYSKVPGSSGKCKELIVFDDHLLAASTSGLFEIDDSAHVVVDEPISAIQVLDESHKVILSTYDHSVKLFEVHDDVWVEIAVMDPDDVILDIFQDKSGDVWLAGSSKVMNIELGDSIKVLKEYPIDNHRFDDILMVNIKDTTFFINTQGYFYVDQANDKMASYKKWEKKLDLPVNYFKDALNFTWIYNGKQWYEISEFGDITPHKYFGVFPNLRKITYDKDLDKYWLITNDNDLLAYDHKSELVDSLAHPLFLKKITGSDGILQNKDKLNIKYDNTFLSFEMSKPDYLGLLNTEYMYKLEGMNEHWSDWMHNSQIDFSYLPPGDYKLYVKSRDSFGNVEEAESISFKVGTPYWQQPWFYAMQIIVFGGLVIVSSRLNQHNRLYRILKSGLSILTLILIIEFCQSAMASYLNIASTPVMDFAVDVGTALLVFPLERLLRYVMIERTIKQNIKNEQLEEAAAPEV